VNGTAMDEIVKFVLVILGGILTCGILLCFPRLNIFDKRWKVFRNILKKNGEDWKVVKSKTVIEKEFTEIYGNRLDLLVKLVDVAIYIWFCLGYIYGVLGVVVCLCYNNLNNHLPIVIMIAFLSLIFIEVLIYLERKLAIPYWKYEAFFNTIT
jgi:hypothetical protein